MGRQVGRFGRSQADYGRAGRKVCTYAGRMAGGQALRKAQSGWAGRQALSLGQVLVMQKALWNGSVLCLTAGMMQNEGFCCNAACRSVDLGREGQVLRVSITPRGDGMFPGVWVSDNDGI